LDFSVRQGIAIKRCGEALTTTLVDGVKQDCLIEDGKIMARHLDNAMTCLVSIGARWAMSDYRADSLQAREAMCGFNPIHQAAALIDENGCKQVPVVSE
jgi:hypothetical protein